MIRATGRFRHAGPERSVVEIFLVVGRETRLIEIAEGARVEELIVDLEPGHRVWLEGAEEPLELEAILIEVGIKHRTRVHASRCRRVDIGVRYNGETKHREFPPAATITAVFEWAVGPHGFNIPEGDRADLTLKLGKDEPDRSDHVGSWATDCGVTFDLAPIERFEG
jgi:hypothetical protein